jgi:ABC-type antimicrobial peptide transport system permease subunit
MALGSQRNQVMSLILSESMKVVLIGVVAGIPLALLAARALGSILFSLGPSDPVSLAIVVVLLAVVAGLAGMIPALRATKVDPMVALRYE